MPSRSITYICIIFVNIIYANIGLASNFEPGLWEIDVNINFPNDSVKYTEHICAPTAKFLDNLIASIDYSESCKLPKNPILDFMKLRDTCEINKTQIEQRRTVMKYETHFIYMKEFFPKIIPFNYDRILRGKWIGSCNGN